jgi:hypothetical protein
MKKSDNFNPGKWLVENKLTTQSKINEIKVIDPLQDQIDLKITNIIEPKIGGVNTQMIDDVLHVDFDDIGNLWTNVFEEAFGHEYDEDNDEDYDNFNKIQYITRDLLSNNGEIEVEYDR